MAAYWASTGGQMVKLPASTSTGRRRSSGTSIQPSRQPVIEKYLLNEPKTTPVREVSQALRGLHAVGDPVVDLVADEAYAVLLAPAGDRGELVGRHHRAGGVGGGGDDEAGDGPSTAASCATVGWNRVSGPQSISTTSQPRAVSTLR